MTKDQLLKKISNEIFKGFQSKKEAAEKFGITQVKLSQVLSGEAVKIPNSILKWVGYELDEPKYVKIKPKVKK